MQSRSAKTLKSEMLLLLASIIWGFAFVAQRAGMKYVGPFTFNGVRFSLGVMVLLPLLLKRVKEEAPGNKGNDGFFTGARDALSYGILTGVILFAGASLQQVGIVYTTAGKAGFITGLYVVIVPILGFFLRERLRMSVWIGAVSAVGGLYLLSVKEGFVFEKGDLFVLASAFFFALHVHAIGWMSSRIDIIKLACLQFSVCALLSIAAALGWEKITLGSLKAAAVPIIYGGVFSVGIAYTLQVAGQRHAPPSPAAIILSLEAVFAAFGGWLLLGETLPPRDLLGCILMLSGMLISQIGPLGIHDQSVGKKLRLK